MSIAGSSSKGGGNNLIKVPLSRVEKITIKIEKLEELKLR